MMMPEGRAGREEAEIVHVGGRRDRDEAADFGAAHQQLHADQRAEAESRNPGGLASGWIDCTQSSAAAASDNSPMPLSKLPWLRPTPRKLKRSVGKAAGDEGLVQVPG
jgi:hypothetical protein